MDFSLFAVETRRSVAKSQTNWAYDAANAGLYVAGTVATAKDVLSDGSELAHVGGEFLIPVQWTLDLNNPKVSAGHMWLNTAVNTSAFIPIVNAVTIPGAVLYNSLDLVFPGFGQGVVNVFSGGTSASPDSPYFRPMDYR